MKVVRPSDNPNHVLSIVPRKYVQDAVFFIKHKISQDEYTSQAVTCVENNGRLEVSIEYDFVKLGDYDVYLEDTEGNLLYRGSLFATDQADLQNYKLENE